MAAKKSAVKTSAARTSAAKKTAMKKSAAKKTAVKKPAAKTSAATQVNAGKSVAKKSGATPTKKPPQSMPYELGKWAHVYTRAPGEQRYWLVKSEPDVFSFGNLQAAPGHTTSWDSVRNTGARNFLRDAMKRGDLAFYYHSNTEPSAIVGICEVVRESYPDHTAFDPKHPYYDPASVRDTPTWFMVDVKAVRALEHPVTLAAIKANPALSEMAFIKVGRLSVVPVTREEWDIVLTMSRAG
jgi:predicted RNA-binding protein with PUA-like domain